MKSLLAYRRFALAPVLALAFTGAAMADGHGYISAIPQADPGQNVFPVNIEKINGKDADDGPNYRAPAGSTDVVVSLVYNSSWGTGMSDTQEEIYYKDITVDVEEGKTYYLGATVDESASEEAQQDGSFWTPVITEVR